MATLGEVQRSPQDDHSVAWHVGDVSCDAYVAQQGHVVIGRCVMVKVALIIPEGSYTLEPGPDSPYDKTVIMVDLEQLDMEWECDCNESDNSGKMCDNCVLVDSILEMKDALH